MKAKVLKRRKLQWILLWIVIITVALGWKYPFLGFSVPIVMMAGIIGSFMNGRYVCGNLCPRGGFFDRLLTKISLNRGIPPFFRNPILRWFLFAALMGLMIFRLLQSPDDIRHWGHVFWLMCAVTTGVGLLLAIIWHPRAWCAFCPMGTMQSAIGGNKNRLLISKERCVKCGLCEKNCTFDLKIYRHADSGILPDKDCLKCSECIAACPKDALRWPSD